MSCCGGNGLAQIAQQNSEKLSTRLEKEAVKKSAVEMSDGRLLYTLSVPDIHCGSCVQLIEKHLKKLAGVTEARVNLTQRRLSYCLDKSIEDPAFILDELDNIGYPATSYTASDDRNIEIKSQKRLLVDLAVAGFAMANIMLLSVSVWSGAEGFTRDLFHLISGLIAVPAVLFSGQSFFVSAVKALKSGYLNMDVPISVAVLLALAMSIFESVHGGGDAYFEASTMLLFFLLIGRYLDRLMKEKAKNIISNLKDLAPKGAEVRGEKGALQYMSTDELAPGMVMLIHPDARVPVDGIIVSGNTEVDRSLVTGESMPISASVNMQLEGGVLNLSKPIEVEVVHSAKESFLAGLVKMIEDSETANSRYVGIAERMVKLYAPAVHLLALIAFILWAFLTSGDFHTATNIAIAVLIITCPCALGLAVPMVQVSAASRLFQEGIVLKNGPALEKLAEIDHVIFDKTGTLTTGKSQPVSKSHISNMDASLALSLARASTHPASRAITQLLKGSNPKNVTDIKEIAGKGVSGIFCGDEIRLGQPKWVAEISMKGNNISEEMGDVCFAHSGKKLQHFDITETLRPGAQEVVAKLLSAGKTVEILSGDSEQRVKHITALLGIESYTASMSPQKKMDVLTKLEKSGRKVLMIGDGLNDAPSLAVCHVSMAPGSASDISRLTADFVFLRDSLYSVSDGLDVAHISHKLIKQNFALALVYNCIAVPIAFAGYVTPLVAALSMSLSSVLVVANSMRLYKKKKSHNENRPLFDKQVKARTA